MRVLLPIASVSLLLLISGCGDISPPKRAPLAPPGILIPTPDKPAPPPPPPSAPGHASKPAPPPPPPPTSTQPAQPAPGMQQVPAGVGVGKKGHYGQGPVVTPLEVYWRAQEAITFKVQIAEAMKLYKAMNDNHGPATHEEFMQKIIQENRIRLPQLPYGHRYLYDPKKEQLMVEKPAQ